ncbi:MAG: 3'(2'),5'-bisphosphate nucleotidase CysQ [Geodermatophilaceae bacterium]|nr:3'(2'),5'-bisphosphate nucleotidase CysQ [Geodermatophilaceae bacterium]
MTSDHVLAARIATDAGQVLLGIRAEHAGTDPAVLKKAGDAGAQLAIAAALAEARPDDSVLSEEAADDLNRLQASRVWIVDPLDGTREYSEEGRTDWAVHVALWESGRIVAGAVALPALEVVFGTGEPPVVPPAYGGPLRLIVSRTRASALVLAVAERLGAVTVPMGSAGAKAMSVVRGESEAYLHTGGQYEWDSAAPVAVAAAAGLHTSRVDGSPLTYNNEDPYLPDLLICRPELAARMLEAVAAL